MGSLAVDVAGLALPHPLMLGSGPIAVRAVDLLAFGQVASAIVTKSISAMASRGSPKPRIAKSDRDGMRIVIELKRGELPDVVLNNLYKHTKLQMSYGITLLAISGGRPRVLNLLQIIELFVEFRKEVVRRRIEFELRKAEARAHILEGLRIALDHLEKAVEEKFFLCPYIKADPVFDKLRDEPRYQEILRKMNLE